MNFYGTTVGPQHTLVGRIVPMWEAFRLAIHRAANLPPPLTRHTHTLPEWGHNVTDELTKTLFKGLVRMAPKDNQANEVNAFKVGQMVRLLIRVAIYLKLSLGSGTIPSRRRNVVFAGCILRPFSYLNSTGHAR